MLSPPAVVAAPPRLDHIDTLRVALTAGVIAVHAVISYGGPGSWFYHEGEFSDGVLLAVTVPVAFGALFGMGAFFFVAAAFLPGSLARKGTRRFLADRWTRLGWPMLAFALLVVPLVVWTVAEATGRPATARGVWAAQLRELDTGPLWFVWVLLLFSAVAAGLLRKLPPPSPRELRPRLLVLTGAGIALATFLLRLRFPVNSHQPGAAHVWQWGQCAGLFVLGVVAGRQGWLGAIPPRIRRGCTVLMVLGALAVIGTLAAAGDGLDAYGGGWHWQSLLVAVIEAVVSVSTTIVVVDLFRGVRPGPVLGRLTRWAYGAYLLQTPVLVGMALALRPVPLPSWAKLLVVLPAAVAASFLLAGALLRVPALRRAL